MIVYRDRCYCCAKNCKHYRQCEDSYYSGENERRKIKTLSVLWWRSNGKRIKLARLVVWLGGMPQMRSENREANKS